MKNRIVQLDFLKCVFILHVIMIHLVYLGQTYPWLKGFFLLYTTPVFFVISGFLAHADKPFSEFFQKVKWWLVPYIVMEGLYIILASILPINEHIDRLDILVFLRKLAMEPLGPYWYIHNLIISYVAYYAVSWLYRNKIKIGALLLTVAFIGIFVVWLDIISWHCCIFFTIGVGIKLLRVPFLSVFRPSLFAIIVTIVGITSWQSSYPALVRSLWLTYVMTVFWLTVYRFMPQLFRKGAFVIGKNTLPILLFSPAFTIITKLFVPLFTFDPTVILFTITAVAFTVCGCLLTAKAMDYLRISPYFCGKDHFFCRK